MADEQQKELAKSIAEQYAPKQASDIDMLRKIDAKAKRPANIFAYTFGVLGALVLGVGMCFAMGTIGSSVPLGIVIGVIGLAMVCVNYPIFKAILRRSRKKYASAIESVASRILNEN